MCEPVTNMPHQEDLNAFLPKIAEAYHMYERNKSNNLKQILKKVHTRFPSITDVSFAQIMSGVANEIGYDESGVYDLLHTVQCVYSVLRMYSEIWECDLHEVHGIDYAYNMINNNRTYWSAVLSTDLFEVDTSKPLYDLAIEIIENEQDIDDVGSVMAATRFVQIYVAISSVGNLIDEE
jgi:hypothetical protein